MAPKRVAPVRYPAHAPPECNVLQVFASSDRRDILEHVRSHGRECQKENCRAPPTYCLSLWMVYTYGELERVEELGAEVAALYRLGGLEPAAYQLWKGKGYAIARRP